jgi:acetyltransferase
VRQLSAESRYFRFMDSLHELSPPTLARFTQIDYSREMALVAVSDIGGKETQLGVARYIINPDGENCEFAIVVADAIRGKGLGQALMLTLMDVARSKGLKGMVGEVMGNNTNMLSLMKRLAFTVESHPDDDSLKVVHYLL